MSERNKMRSTRNNKKSDGKFHSKHINHSPQAESTRSKVIFHPTDESKHAYH